MALRDRLYTRRIEKLAKSTTTGLWIRIYESDGDPEEQRIARAAALAAGDGLSVFAPTARTISRQWNAPALEGITRALESPSTFLGAQRVLMWGLLYLRICSDKSPDAFEDSVDVFTTMVGLETEPERNVIREGYVDARDNPGFDNRLLEHVLSVDDVYAPNVAQLVGLPLVGPPWEGGFDTALESFRSALAREQSDHLSD